MSKSKKPDLSKNAKKQLFSMEKFEADHKSLEAILHGLPRREVASRRATTATGKDVYVLRTTSKSFGILFNIPVAYDTYFNVL